MSKILDILLNYQGRGFDFFDQVILFGSSLSIDNPNDIDILLVYKSATLEEVSFEKDRVEELLAELFLDYTLHFTTLSKSELEQTNFLADILHSKIRG